MKNKTRKNEQFSHKIRYNSYKVIKSNNVFEEAPIYK